MGHKTTKENFIQASSHASVCTVRENCASKVSAPGQRTITYAQQRLLRQCHSVIVILSMKLRHCGVQCHIHIYILLGQYGARLIKQLYIPSEFTKRLLNN
jgi:hypothetical protein